MRQRTFSRVAGVIFSLIAVLHVLRIARGWPATLAGWEMPTWVSWVALAVAAYLAYEGFRLGRRVP